MIQKKNPYIIFFIDVCFCFFRFIRVEYQKTMKFAEHLGAHITPEWRKQYIQYEVCQQVMKSVGILIHADLSMMRSQGCIFMSLVLKIVLDINMYSLFIGGDKTIDVLKECANTCIYSQKYKLGRDGLCFNFSSQIHAIKYLQTDIELNQ